MNNLSRPRNKRGGVIIIMALMMSLILFGFMAIAVDLGNVFYVRQQMQNAADAAALYGAGYLFPPTSSGQPNFSAAQTQALNFIPNNKVNGVALSTGTVTTGYWDLTQASPGVRTPSTIGPNDAAAVQVTITKSTGVNGGPVNFYFARLFGINTTNVTVTAVAVVGSPTSIPAGGLFPLVMSLGTLNTYWSSSTNQPVGGGTPTQIIATISAVGWTSFNVDASDVPTVRNLITNGSPIGYKIGDPIYIEPGVKASLYGSLPKNKDIIIPVVSSSNSSGTQTITSYTSFHIISANQGAKTVTGYLNPGVQLSTQGSIGGLNYGVYSSPRLVK